MAPEFTFVIPVYKVESYLDICVRSVIDQTYENFEVILVDDGSPDNCPRMCDEYALRDSRIKVIHKENGGLSDARNAGIRAASGKYIIFLDSDDHVSEDACEKLMEYAVRDCDIIVGDGECEGTERTLKHPFEIEVCSGENFLKTALRHRAMPMAAWLYVYRREFLLKNGLEFKLGILHEDEQFTPRAFLAAKRVVNSHVCFYHYVLRNGSITTKPDLRKNALDLLSTCRELEQIYAQLPEDTLQIQLTDLLAEKYLSLFQQGRLYRWGRDYCPKGYLLHLAKLPKTRLKTGLFALSPRLYWYINHISKRIRH